MSNITVLHRSGGAKKTGHAQIEELELTEYLVDMTRELGSLCKGRKSLRGVMASLELAQAEAARVKTLLENC